MRNEQQLIQLRPELQLPTGQAKPDEQFQNETLRPILKMQHALLVNIFSREILKRKSVYFQLTKQARLEWITNSIRSDLRFRNMLVGTVIGHFTLEELLTYQTHEPECSRRMVDLIIQRLQSVDFEAL